MIITNQVLQIISSLSVKKIQTELWTNKPLSLKWHVSYAIQNRKKLFPRNSVTFDAKKWKKLWEQGWVETQLLKQKPLLDRKNSSGEKPP